MIRKKSGKQTAQERELIKVWRNRPANIRTGSTLDPAIFYQWLKQNYPHLIPPYSGDPYQCVAAIVEASDREHPETELQGSFAETLKIKKNQPRIDECEQCKSLRQIINNALDIAKKRLKDGDLVKAAECIEIAGKWIPSFLSENHGPQCSFSALKNKSGGSETIH